MAFGERTLMVVPAGSKIIACTSTTTQTSSTLAGKPHVVRVQAAPILCLCHCATVAWLAKRHELPTGATCTRAFSGWMFTNAPYVSRCILLGHDLRSPHQCCIEVNLITTLALKLQSADDCGCVLHADKILAFASDPPFYTDGTVVEWRQLSRLPSAQT